MLVSLWQEVGVDRLCSAIVKSGLSRHAFRVRPCRALLPAAGRCPLVERLGL